MMIKAQSASGIRRMNDSVQVPQLLSRRKLSSF